MGLDGYRAYKESFEDRGLDTIHLLDAAFTPDFRNRSTMQIWDVSNGSIHVVNKWVGATLTVRTSHEIFIINNSESARDVEFTPSYILADEPDPIPGLVVIGAGGSAHFYCTAIFKNNQLIFIMRIGTQDDRKI